ncbi:MAG: cation diffusion facilitator family transporter [Verrucomicrobiota bacterium]
MKAETKRLGYIEGWVSVVLNTALFGLKYWVGILCGSIAMIADAWHTLSDTLTSVVVLLGFWIASRKPDEKHPFGHGRAEVIAAVVIGTLLAVVGVRFLQESIMRLLHYRGAVFGVGSIAVFLVSVFLKEGLARFSIWAGRRTGAQSLIADGWHHRSDAVASALIVVGALLGRMAWWIDGVMGILVSLLILYATYDILRDASSSLVGEAADADMEQRIQAILREKAPEGTAPHHFHVHRYGEHVELTFHVRFPPGMTIGEVHAKATAIERAVREELHVEATIHAEPRSQA